MKYTDSKLLDELAAQYVLGTLRGQARSRFESVMATNSEAKSLVKEWEYRLSPMNESIEPVAPPVELLGSIQRRLGHEADVQQEAKTFWQGLSFWRGWGIASTVFSMALLAVVLVRQPETVYLQPNGDMVAVVNTPQDQPLWMVRCDMKTEKVMVKAWNKNIPKASNGKYKLWLVSENGGKKVLSLGELPMNGEMEMPMPGAMAKWQGNKVMAVTIEPMDSKDTDDMKGEMMFKAPLVAF